MIKIEDSGERASKVWQALAEQIAEAVPDFVIAGEVEKAMKWAMCADACFYQATGEGPGMTVNEIIFPKAA